MALDLKTDLIAQVMAAGDPARQRAAALRLERMAGQTVAPAAETAVADNRTFAEVVAGISPPDPAVPLRTGTEGARIALHNRALGAGSERQVPEALRQFEAVALQSFLSAMMPKAAEAMAGGGTAGSMWSSMMVEHMAAAMASAGGIGLADRLAQADQTLAHLRGKP